MKNPDDELEFLNSSMYSVDLRGKIDELKESIRSGTESVKPYIKRLGSYKDNMIDEIKEIGYSLMDGFVETAKYTLPLTSFYWCYKRTGNLGEALFLESVKQIGSLGLTGMWCLPFLAADAPQKLAGPFALGLYSVFNLVFAAAYVGGQLQDELAQKAEERKKERAMRK